MRIRLWTNFSVPWFDAESCFVLGTIGSLSSSARTVAEKKIYNFYQLWGTSRQIELNALAVHK